jgi:nucleotide-binding universal stress UspA family protein
MFKKIVLALDGSPGSHRVLEVAGNLVVDSTQSLVVVHAVEFVGSYKGGPAPAHLNEEDIQRQVKGQVDALAGVGTQVELRTVDVKLGGPAVAIAEVAREVQADLIVTGTRGHSAIAGVFVGSVAHRLLHIAPCPVLVVRPPEE